jgi:uncharacterized protein YjbI with pentapeptide repeats
MWPLVIFITGILFIMGVIAGGYHYKWAWTGFSERRFVKANDEEVREARTLWDWFQLLIIPAALALIALLFDQTQAERDRTRADQRARIDREITVDNQQEEALGSYTEAMSKLMLESQLRDSEQGSDLRVLASTRTLSTLRRLNGERKGIVLQFLADANLIRGPDDPVIDMTKADLSSAVATRAYLVRASLNKVDLQGANLRSSYLGWAYLGGANLRNADLSYSYLRGSDLSTVKMDSADLRYADLTDARLNDSNLEGADMRSAALCGATLLADNLEHAKLNEAIASTRTQWPTNFDWRSAGVKLGGVYDGYCEMPHP